MRFSFADHEGFCQWRSSGVTRIAEIGCLASPRQHTPACLPAAIMIVTIYGNHQAQPHVLSHDLKDSMARSCPGPFGNFVPPNHPLLINNWVDRISFREFESRSSRVWLWVASPPRFQLFDRGRWFLSYPFRRPHSSSGRRVPDHALNLCARLPRSEIPDGHGGRLRAFCLRESGKLFDLTE